MNGNIITVQCNSCNNRMQVKIPKLEQQQKYITYLKSLLTINGISYAKSPITTYGQYLHLFCNVDKKHSVNIRI